MFIIARNVVIALSLVLPLAANAGEGRGNGSRGFEGLHQGVRQKARYRRGQEQAI